LIYTILYEVPPDASPGDVFYGSIELTKADIYGAEPAAEADRVTKYALVRVTVSPIIIPETEEDVPGFIASLGETNFVSQEIPSFSYDNGRWASSNQIIDGTVNEEISASVGTIYLFHIEAFMFPGDVEGPLKGVDIDITPLRYPVQAQDSAFEVTQYAFESLDIGNSNRNRYINGLKLEGDDLEGKSFYITIRAPYFGSVCCASAIQYYHIKLTIERPSMFMNKVAWE